METVKIGRPPKGEEFNCPTRRVSLPAHLTDRLRKIAIKMLAEEAAGKKPNEEEKCESATKI